MTIKEAIALALYVVETCGYRGVVEADLQVAIEDALKLEVITHHREHSLSKRDRPDFVLPTTEGLVVIECKVDGAGAAVARQLARYAGYPAVKAIALVTTRLRHANQIPDSIDGVPVCVWSLPNLP